ncbi:Peptide chain release factor 2 [Rickettsiales bacterium Ac37b]|nr:Peptide chain release factor 2 [Rickettsiales bacterium Ac37b]
MNSFEEHVALLELAELEEDTEVINEVIATLSKLEKQTRQLEVECLFSGEVDSNDCFLEIHAGAGGTESHDWAEMLLRMYSRFVERHNFKSEIIDEINGEEAGIKSITLKIMGHNAYGWLKTEGGVHRLVRISPFNAAGKRQTSFASVWVYPLIDDNVSIEINEKDLRIDTYRASGAGGQHVNKTDSAVRITHLPTGIVVQSQNDRSQHRNRAEAFSMLKARLYEIEMRKQQEKVDAMNATKTDNSWGHQIRSYVLHPYQMVKDLRHDYETSDTQKVLDGEIDGFIEKSLALLVTNKINN